MRENIANHLLTIGAVTLRPNEPFTWSSGMKSPIYCDNRLIMSYPEVRKEVSARFEALVNEQYSEAEVVAGTATAGIPHAAWLSDRLNVPMLYVRSTSKGHGKGNQIEGKLVKGQKVVIVEDLISTGGSVINAASAIREAGGIVLGVVAVFTYELEKGKDMLAEAKLSWSTLTDYSTLIRVAERNGHLTEREREKLTRWRENPSSEEWMSPLS